MRVRVPPLALMDERYRRLKILDHLRFWHPVDLRAIVTGRVKPTDPAAVLDVEQSFLKPVPPEKSLDGLKPQSDGSDSVE